MKRWVDEEGLWEYQGMETDYCRALSSSLFEGDDERIEFVEFTEPEGGFTLLADEAVDVIAGVTWNLQNDIKEPATGQRFSFTQPYFYGFSEQKDNFALATRQDDHAWATFVFWTVDATIHAEEEGLSIISHA